MSDKKSIEIGFPIHKLIEIHRESFDESRNDILERLLKDQLKEAGLLPQEEVPAATVIESPDKDDDGISWSDKGVELPHSTELRMRYDGKFYRGRIDNGRWQIGEKTANTPSEAAGFVIRQTRGRRIKRNGWRCWQVKRPGDSSWYRLDNLRRKSIKNVS